MNIFRLNYIKYYLVSSLYHHIGLLLSMFVIYVSLGSIYKHLSQIKCLPSYFYNNTQMSIFIQVLFSTLWLYQQFV